MCEVCHCDIHCKPVGSYLYNNARCWPCCGSLLHTVYVPTFWTVKRCSHFGMAFYFGQPQWERMNSLTRYRFQFLRKVYGIPQHDSLLCFRHAAHDWSVELSSQSYHFISPLTIQATKCYIVAEYIHSFSS